MSEHICDGQWRYYCEACSGLPEAGGQTMSDQDELRDRIAEVVHDENERIRSGNGTRYTPLKYDELPDNHRENREYIAQAIVDDLELTVERRFVYATDLAREDEPVTDDMAVRVVGKWEKQ